METDVLVIGGGPAGLMAAETLAGAGQRVIVAERMPTVGRKLLMAGRGGLNLTHGEPLPQLLARYGAAPAVRDAVAAFPPAALVAWCEALGEACFTGSSGRVFPRAMKASPLLRAWLGRLAKLGVRILPRHRWVGGQWFEGPAGEVTIEARARVLALGGASWPRLGSDGSWTGLLPMAEVAPLRPANAGFRVAWSEPFRRRFEGQPLKRIALGFGGQAVRGEAMVTARGIEGGAVYALCAAIREAIAASGPAVVRLDLRPDLSLDELARRLEAPRRAQSLSTFLRKAGGLSPVAVGLVQEARHGGDARGLAELVKAVSLRFEAIEGLDRAISTAGGVAFAGLDERLMLRAHPGWFVAGEMLDWEAPTGGYLLQGCFSTGVAAARGAIGVAGGSARLERVVAPVHQGLAPAGVGHVAVGALLEVAVDVADHLAHRGVVVVVEFRGLLGA